MYRSPGSTAVKKDTKITPQTKSTPKAGEEKHLREEMHELDPNEVTSITLTHKVEAPGFIYFVWIIDMVNFNGHN